MQRLQRRHSWYHSDCYACDRVLGVVGFPPNISSGTSRADLLCEVVRQKYGEPGFCVFRVRIRLERLRFGTCLLERGFKHVIFIFDVPSK